MTGRQKAPSYLGKGGRGSAFTQSHACSFAQRKMLRAPGVAALLLCEMLSVWVLFDAAASEEMLAGTRGACSGRWDECCRFLSQGRTLIDLGGSCS